METKTCSKCARVQPLDQYGKQRSSPDGLRYECLDCQRQYMAEWRANNRQYMRDASARRWERMSDEEKERKRALDLKRYHAAPEVARDKLLRRKYGIGLAEYDEMLTEQQGMCAICNTEPGAGILHVDHHHGTGAVRGLLCTNCNNGLGRFGDNPEFLRNAITYLLNT